MQLASIKSAINVATACVALLVVVCIPGGYFWGAVSSIDTRIAHVAKTVALHAVRMAPEVDAREEGKFLKQFIEDLATLDGTWVEVLDANGSLIVGPGAPAPTWALKREATLPATGSAPGVVRVAVPLQPLFSGIAVAALFGFAVATLIVTVMRNMTFRTLEDAFVRLDHMNHELAQSNSTLREQAEHLAEAQGIGGVASWTFSKADNRYSWSPEIYKLLGYEPESFSATAMSVLRMCTPETARKVHAILRRAMEKTTTETVNVTITRGDGGLGCYSITVRPAFNDNGALTGVKGTLHDITLRTLAEARLQQLANFDPLTGLPNRAAVNEALNSALAETEQEAGLFALLLVDLDHFKEVNDTLGHAAGDQLLIEVVARIRAVLGDDDFFARLGGDEFAIVLRHMTTLKDIEGIALRILSAASGQITLDAGEASTGASIGIAIGGRDGRASGELLRNADLALYRSKARGRGTVSVFSADMDAEVQSKAKLARDLRASLVSGQGLDLHYQPQVDLVTGRVIGFEALLRWNHPERGNVPPSEFIPVAETSRLICDLGQWVLRKATRQAKDWMLGGGPLREISVNISAAQIWYSDVLADVDRALAESGLPPQLLCLELTESLMASPDDDRVRTVLEGLKARGVQLALDDFGTGYSSLSHLAKLPFDKIKIDRVFVSALSTSEQARELLKGIITLGRGLRMKVHVEGAESTAEIRTLCDFAADFVQGFAISHAVPADEAICFALACDAHEICEDMLDLLDASFPALGAVRSAA